MLSRAILEPPLTCYLQGRRYYITLVEYISEARMHAYIYCRSVSRKVDSSESRCTWIRYGFVVVLTSTCRASYT